jgi:hypothetical protein
MTIGVYRRSKLMESVYGILSSLFNPKVWEILKIFNSENIGSLIEDYNAKDFCHCLSCSSGCGCFWGRQSTPPTDQCPRNPRMENIIQTLSL